MYCSNMFFVPMKIITLLVLSAAAGAAWSFSDESWFLQPRLWASVAAVGFVLTVLMMMVPLFDDQPVIGNVSIASGIAVLSVGAICSISAWVFPYQSMQALSFVFAVAVALGTIRLAIDQARGWKECDAEFPTWRNRPIDDSGSIDDSASAPPGLPLGEAYAESDKSE